MMTVNQVSKLSGVSVRTLHYYDQIGLLSPCAVSDAGYRLYDQPELERLQMILLFRELEFPLKDIKRIMNDSSFDRTLALSQQIELLTLKKEHLENLIVFARGIKLMGVKNMDFSAFDTRKIDEYSEQAKAQWGHTDAYAEFSQKTKSQSREEQTLTANSLMSIFVEFGTMTGLDPADEKVQHQVKKLQDFITAHYYTCTDEILSGLGQMYCAGGEFTENIDRAAGTGCADFTAKAIKIYCGRN